MKTTQIIETLREKLNVSGGRHLYGVLGTYPSLAAFGEKLHQARTVERKRFPEPIDVNRGILDSLPDEEFCTLAGNEARMPEPTAAQVDRAFEAFLRKSLGNHGLVVLHHLELVFAYDLEFSPLRTLATDRHRIILLLPGHRRGARIVLYPDQNDRECSLPVNLIANNHLFEITDGDA